MYSVLFECMPPQRQDLRQEIGSSNSDNWDFIDMPPTWVLWPEQLSISQIPEYKDSIPQPDFVSLPDPDNDLEGQVRISYRGVPFDQLPIYELDGHRITMIKPQLTDSPPSLTQYEAKLSQIMSQDDFMRKQGGSIDVQIN